MSPQVDVVGRRPPNPFKRRCAAGCGQNIHAGTCTPRAGTTRNGRPVGGPSWLNGARNWAVFGAVSGMAGMASGTGWASWLGLGGLSMASAFGLVHLQQKRKGKPPRNIHAPRPRPKRKPRRPGHGPHCRARSSKTCRCPKGRKGRKR